MGVEPTSEPITVLIVDDHPVAREGLRAMLETDPGVKIVGEAADGFDALAQADELCPAVVLMDVRMPLLDGLEATRRLKLTHAAITVILMTSYEDDAMVVDAVRAGASGYLMKDASRDLLRHTIRAVASGGILIKAALLRRAIGGLTPRSPGPAGRAVVEPEADDLAAPLGGLAEADELNERERLVLRLLADGRTNKEIGDTLALAEVTIKKHVQSIIAKLHVADRTHAATQGIRLGLIT